MKRIEAIVRATKVNEVYRRSRATGPDDPEIEGHGKTKGIEQQVRGRRTRLPSLQKARIELVVEDAEVTLSSLQHQKAAFTSASSTTSSMRAFVMKSTLYVFPAPAARCPSSCAWPSISEIHHARVAHELEAPHTLRLPWWAER